MQNDEEENMNALRDYEGEWNAAKNADEPEYYYFVKYSYQRNHIVKLYKPSVAKLVSEWTGKTLIKVPNQNY